MTHKFSYYNIVTSPIHTSEKEKIIIYSTRSGEALVINIDLLHKLENQLFHEIDADTFNLLLSKKFIVPYHENELLAIVEENKLGISNETLLYEVIQPSAMCQLGCDYCGQEHIKHNAPNSVSNLIIDRINNKLNRNCNFRSLKIGWFGGEPLMALNEIRYLTTRFKETCEARSLNYSAKVVTNGLSLKEKVFVELAKDLAVKSIEVTLDGTEEYHDNRRHTKEGRGTYKYILKNIIDIVNREDFKELGCSISIRCNVDKRNYKGVSLLIRELASHNLQNKISHFYLASVYSWGNDAHLKSFSKEEFAEMEIDWIIEMYKYGFQPWLFPGRVRSVCLAVSPNSEMYDAYGNVFNCTEVSYVPIYKNTNYVLGNVKNSSNSLSTERPHSDWNNEILKNDYQCTTCRMLPVCGGACPKQWAEGRAACPTPKFNIESRLLLSYLHAKRGIKELSELADLEEPMLT